MKKLAKVFAMVAGLAAMLSLSSCVLTVKAFTGNNVKIVNDTDFDVRVLYNSGAAWEGEEKEITVSHGNVEKINCSEFWPLIIINSLYNTEAVIDSVSPYKGTIKVSKLEFKTSEEYTGGNTTGGNTTGGVSTGGEFDDDFLYTVHLTNVNKTNMYGRQLNSDNLVKGTDYTTDGINVYLTDSGRNKVGLTQYY